jgi:hypothetical protein
VRPAAATAPTSQRVSHLIVASATAAGTLPAKTPELRAVRPLLAAAYGPESAQVRNLDKQAARLRTPQ